VGANASSAAQALDPQIPAHHAGENAEGHLGKAEVLAAIEDRTSRRTANARIRRHIRSGTPIINESPLREADFDSHGDQKMDFAFLSVVGPVLAMTAITFLLALAGAASNRA
jgi:hypothetical protein